MIEQRKSITASKCFMVDDLFFLIDLKKKRKKKVREKIKTDHVFQLPLTIDS